MTLERKFRFGFWRKVRLGIWATACAFWVVLTALGGFGEDWDVTWTGLGFVLAFFPLALGELSDHSAEEMQESFDERTKRFDELMERFEALERKISVAIERTEVVTPTPLAKQGRPAVEVERPSGRGGQEGQPGLSRNTHEAEPGDR